MSRKGIIDNSDSAILGRMRKNVSRGLSADSPGLALIWDIIISAMSIISLPVRVFLRKNFGERTISSISIFLSIGWLGIAPEVYHLIMSQRMISNQNGWPGFNPIYVVIFFVTFCLFAFIIRSQAVRARTQGKAKIYSFYRGDSIYFSPKSKLRFNSLENVQIWVGPEQILFVLIGIVTWFYLDVYIGFIITVGMFALSIEEYAIYNKAIETELNIIDGEIESEYIEELQKELSLRFSGSFSERGTENSTSENTATILSDQEVDKYIKINTFASNEDSNKTSIMK